jgi:hypothetical protein
LGLGIRKTKTNVSDPDKDSIRPVDPDPDPEGQKLLIKVEKIKKFHVLKYWMFFFEGLKASSVACTS